MTIKLEAAYHEAGHVVVAWVSHYHNVVSGIDLAKYGAGSANVSVSRAKCQDAGKIVDAAISKDQDFTKASAVIFMAGYQAEQIAAENYATLKSNRGCADPDYELAVQVLRDAGLSMKTDRAESDANGILRVHWDLVEKNSAGSLRQGVAYF